MVCREMVCRRICRVQFLGLFDAVNSIAQFQVDTQGMPNARFIRHAVSIDERRVKFQPVLFRPLAGDMERSRTARAPDPLTDPGRLVLHPTSASHGDDDDSATTDLQEVWFPGAHSDIGGGWKVGEGEEWPLSHAPLVWMVQEAQRAGLRFNDWELDRCRCRIEPSLNTPQDSVQTEEGERPEYDISGPLHALRLSATKGLLHDRLKFGQGLAASSVLLWRLMEYIPLARMNLQDDGSWYLVRFPLPRGAMRDIPHDAEIHVSAIRRMQSDPDYRPGNLVVVGVNGRGVRKAPSEYGVGGMDSS